MEIGRQVVLLLFKGERRAGPVLRVQERAGSLGCAFTRETAEILVMPVHVDREVGIRVLRSEVRPMRKEVGPFEDQRGRPESVDARCLRTCDRQANRSGATGPETFRQGGRLRLDNERAVGVWGEDDLVALDSTRHVDAGDLCGEFRMMDRDLSVLVERSVPVADTFRPTRRLLASQHKGIGDGHTLVQAEGLVG